MKCQEVSDLLLAYLDGEVTSSERALVQAHLAACAACRGELAAWGAIQGRVQRFLWAKAAPAHPSPQAWSRLEARLAREARPSSLRRSAWHQPVATVVAHVRNTLIGGMSMKRSFALGAVALLIVALSAVAFVPAVGAQVSEILRWFRFNGLTGEEVSVPSSGEFTPLQPTYLPAGFRSMSVGVNPEAASLSYWNSATDQILLIDQIRLSALNDKSLPAGRRVTVNGRPAVLITGLTGSVTFVLLPPTPAAPAQTPADASQGAPSEPVAASTEVVSYTEGKELVWQVDDIQIRITSNLPVEEMLKVAASLASAEVVK